MSRSTIFCCPVRYNDLPGSEAVWCGLQTHKELADGVVALAKEVQADRGLSALIRRKFAIKCTTGYSLNALVDFHTSDPIEIIKRLMIGSEGTFGFVSQATYNTVPEWPHKVTYYILVMRATLRKYGCPANLLCLSVAC